VRFEKQAELEGDQEARNQPNTILVSDTIVMKNAFEQKYWRLEEEYSPAKSYLERLLEKVEKEDLRAEPLSDVLCVRDEGQGSLQAAWDSTMTLKAIKISATVPLPANGEQLRRRLGIMGAAWCFVASSHSSRPYLQCMDVHSMPTTSSGASCWVSWAEMMERT